MTTPFHIENRSKKYYERREYLEQFVRAMFIAKGGKPVLDVPYYMTIGKSSFAASWFEESQYVTIPLDEFDLQTLSFTYGVTFPTFSPHVTDNLEYRRQAYRYDEILGIIEKYGLPQDSWDGTYASPCYVEAQVWSDMPIKDYCKFTFTDS